MKTKFMTKCRFVETRYPLATQLFKLEQVEKLIKKEKELLRSEL